VLQNSNGFKICDIIFCLVATRLNLWQVMQNLFVFIYSKELFSYQFVENM